MSVIIFASSIEMAKLGIRVHLSENGRNTEQQQPVSIHFKSHRHVR